MEVVVISNLTETKVESNICKVLFSSKINSIFQILDINFYELLVFVQMSIKKVPSRSKYHLAREHKMVRGNPNIMLKGCES